MFEEEKKQYAEDCKTHERPWELWEYSGPMFDWERLGNHPEWVHGLKYRRKPTTFVPEYYSGLNYREAEHLIGKTVECTNHPLSGWFVGTLKDVSRNDVISHFDVTSDGVVAYFVYIRTCEETFKHPTINIGGVELPKPETEEPEKGTKYWLNPDCIDMYWCGYYHDRAFLKAGRVHLTEERAKAWSDWWQAEVIDKIKG